MAMTHRRTSHWAAEANKVLAPLFSAGHEPTRAELRDAYPSGERKYWPYKVWLDAVYHWQNPTAPRHRGTAASLWRSHVNRVG